LKARLHKTRIVVCKSIHNGVVGPELLPDAAWTNRAEPEKNTDDTNLKRRWGMAGMKPIVRVEWRPCSSEALLNQL